MFSITVRVGFVIVYSTGSNEMQIMIKSKNCYVMQESILICLPRFLRKIVIKSKI